MISSLRRALPGTPCSVASAQIKAAAAVLGAAALALLAACKPAAVETADRWLQAYARNDVDRLIDLTHEPDRALIRQALAEVRQVTTGTLALALPPRPLQYEIVELESKDVDRGRFVVLAKILARNPVPSAARRFAQPIEPMPEARSGYRRVLVVGKGSDLSVKLDLERVVARTELVLRFERLVANGDLDAAEALLANVPPPPDDANATRIQDRLLEMLRRGLAIKAAREAADEGSLEGAPMPSEEDSHEGRPKTGAEDEDETGEP